MHVTTSSNAILSLSHPDYPGWQATLDDQPTEILRAYGTFSAIAVPAGDHIIQLSYNPLSYRIGVIISLITWSGITLLSIVLWIRRMLRYAGNQRAAKLG